MIHRYWTGPSSPTEPFVGAVVRGYHREVVDWSDETLPGPLLEWVELRMHVAHPDSAVRHRANMVRLWLLHAHGGVWLDHDVIPLRCLDDLRRPFAAAHGSLCNCVLGFEAGDPLLANAMAAIDVQHHGLPSTEASGERLLGRLWRDRVELRQLPFDGAGTPIPGAEPWVVHLFASRPGRRKHD